MVQLYELLRRYDGMVVRYLLIIHKRRLSHNLLIHQAPGQFPVRTHAAGLQALLD